MEDGPDDGRHHEQTEHRAGPKTRAADEVVHRQVRQRRADDEQRRRRGDGAERAQRIPQNWRVVDAA